MGITCLNPDNNFDIVWAKKYYHPNFEIFGVKMIKVHDGTICFEMLPNNKKTIFKIDTLGNILWNRFYQFQELVSFNEAVLINDSEIVVTAHHKLDGIPLTPHSCNPFFIKFDLNGSIKQINVFKYNSYCAYENLVLQDNYLYASGSLDSNWIYYGVIAKFDLNLNPIWQYKSNIESDYYADIVSIMDNGNLFLGSSTSFGSITTNGIGLCNFSSITEMPDSLIYHEFYDISIISNNITPQFIDTSLLIIDVPIDTISLCINSEIHNDVIYDKDQCLLYPNPSNGELIVDSKETYKIEIFDLHGRKVFVREFLQTSKKHHININDLSNGLYITKIFTINGVCFEKFVLDK